MKPLLLSVLVLGIAFRAEAEEVPVPVNLEQAPEETGLLPDFSAPVVESPPGNVSPADGTIDMFAVPASDGPFEEWLEPLRVSLKHEASYKFDDPRRVVNNRSSVRLEYSKLFNDRYFLQLDTKLNVHWKNDHRAQARDEDVWLDSITREAYFQSSFGNTSLRLGYQILVWGVSEGGAITDEISPRNTSEFFFVSLEESRIGQPMVTVDQFTRAGEWSFFFVPRPSYNQYPDRGTEYDVDGLFGGTPEPDKRWARDDFEYGMRWKHTFGKSDVSLMAASLIDNDYLVRKQRFDMYGVTANIAQGNLLYRAEVGLKRPQAVFAQTSADAPLAIVESDQLDASLGFDYTPGGRTLVYSFEIIRSRLLDWTPAVVGRDQDRDAIVASVSNRFFNDDLTLTWMTIYNRPYSYHHQFLSSYKLDDNASLYLEMFYPDERDERSGSWPYRDQKQIVLKYQYQF